MYQRRFRMTELCRRIRFITKIFFKRFKRITLQPFFFFPCVCVWIIVVINNDVCHYVLQRLGFEKEPRLSCIFVSSQKERLRFHTWLKNK